MVVLINNHYANKVAAMGSKISKWETANKTFATLISKQMFIFINSPVENLSFNLSVERFSRTFISLTDRLKTADIEFFSLYHTRLPGQIHLNSICQIHRDLSDSRKKK